MCHDYSNASTTGDKQQPQPEKAAYTVDPSNPLYSADTSTALLNRLPDAVAAALRSKARLVSDVMLVHMFLVMSDPVSIVQMLLQPDSKAAVAGPFITAAIDEEITRRYRAGTLSAPLAQGGEAAEEFMASQEARAEIAAFYASQERGGATLN